MRSFKKYAKVGVLILVAALVVAQFIRTEKTNPPVRADISADTAAKPMLKRACYNCHSNETVWPWYSNVAPASWLVVSDVNEARQKLNFSEWGNYSAEEQSQMLEEIAEEVESGGMPLWYYTALHSEAKLSPEDKNQIRDWAAKASYLTEETLP